MSHTNIAYIDDNLIQGESFEVCEKNISDTTALVDSLGFTIQPDKSIFVPTQEIQFLGFLLNFRNMTVRLTAEKIDNIVGECRSILTKGAVTIRALAQLVGKLVASEPGVPHAVLHYKPLEQEKDRVLKQHFGKFEEKIVLSRVAKCEIQWWIDNLHSCVKPVSRGPPDMILKTDSSKTGWGGIVENTSLKTGGHWSYTEQNQHINVLEMTAAFLTLQFFCATKSDIHVQLFLDNSAAVANLAHMGGKTDELNSLAREIWFWCIKRNIWLSVAHLPGKLNVEANKMSRTLHDDMEWQLDRDVFLQVCTVLGSCGIDLFASRLNYHLEKYVSFLPDPLARAVDAFTFTWEHFTYYAFPPFSLLGKIIQKISMDKATVVLIAPLWTTQPWFAPMLKLVAADSYILPPIQQILSFPTNPHRKHPLQTTRLAAFRLSGVVSVVEDYQRTLSRSSCVPGGVQLRNSMGHISRNGCFFVSKGRLIHLTHLQ